MGAWVSNQASVTLHFVYVFTFHFHYTDRQLWFSYQTKATPLSFTTYKDVEQLNGEMSFVPNTTVVIPFGNMAIPIVETVFWLENNKTCKQEGDFWIENMFPTWKWVIPLLAIYSFTTYVVGWYSNDIQMTYWRIFHQTKLVIKCEFGESYSLYFFNESCNSSHKKW